MATDPAYRLNWKTGEKDLLIISVGTGAAESLGATAAAPNRNIVSTVAGLPGELMYGMQVDQDISCRSMGRCTYGSRLDREILDLRPRDLQPEHLRPDAKLEELYAVPSTPLSVDLGRHFLYARYNADLSSTGLRALGFPDVDAISIQKMDAVENIPVLAEIGRAAGAVVDERHFGSFL
jgi:hypothetical protein